MSAGTVDAWGARLSASPADERLAVGHASAPSELGDRTDHFTVTLDQFEGPFDLLLSLIGKRDLDVTVLALHRVVDDFLAHIGATSGDLDEISHFVVVAATLLELKASRLLPAGERTDDSDLDLLEASDLLVARLIQYRAFRAAAAHLGDRLSANHSRYPARAAVSEEVERALSTVELDISLQQLAAMASAALTRPRPSTEPAVSHLHAPKVTVAEAQVVLCAWLRRRRIVALDELLGPPQDVETVVARFIALLDLFRAGLVSFTRSEGVMVQWHLSNEGIEDSGEQ